MKITETKIKVKELCEGYHDDGDGGVIGYNGKLTIRPAYQREFVYKDAQRNAVIESARNGFPLNVMYWSKTSAATFEVLDGQQRTISLAQYLNGDYPVKVNGNDKFWHNLTATEKAALEDYELTIYLCEGSEEEKLAWFRVINTAGEVLTPQELLNATYTGTWLADAKTFFSKRNCVAAAMGEGYIKGTPIRQEYLEKVLSWIADRDGLESGQFYMAAHQHDRDANDLWLYYQSVVNWAKMLFPTKRKGITDVQEWGRLYNRYHQNAYNANDLERQLKALLIDDDVTKKAGAVPYLLSGCSGAAERALSLRTFTESQKREAYELQGGMCPYCINEGNNTVYEFEEMEGDHITPWSQGGKTTVDNLQMLCKPHNRAKGGR